MKNYRWLLAPLLMGLCGCGESAVVLSSDGNQRIGNCDPDDWAMCVAKLCPYGFNVIIDPSTRVGIATIKCKQ